MKKQILNIGKALSRAEQKQVFGGTDITHAPIEGGGSCYVTCKKGGVTWSVSDCSQDANNHCSPLDGWQWCSCWG